jgi:hypothetical protein
MILQNIIVIGFQQPYFSETTLKRGVALNSAQNASYEQMVLQLYFWQADLNMSNYNFYSLLNESAHDEV